MNVLGNVLLFNVVNCLVKLGLLVRVVIKLRVFEGVWVFFILSLLSWGEMIDLKMVGRYGLMLKVIGECKNCIKCLRLIDLIFLSGVIFFFVLIFLFFLFLFVFFVIMLDVVSCFWVFVISEMVVLMSFD